MTETRGFEGDVTFSDDGEFIAYYSTLPADDDKNYEKRHDLHFTDVSKSELFILKVSTKQVQQLTTLGGRAHSPIFLKEEDNVEKRRIAFLYRNDVKVTKLYATQYSFADDVFSFDEASKVCLLPLNIYI